MNKENKRKKITIKDKSSSKEKNKSRVQTRNSEKKKSSDRSLSVNKKEEKKEKEGNTKLKRTGTMVETIKEGKNFGKKMKNKKRVVSRSSHSMRTRSKPV